MKILKIFFLSILLLMLEACSSQPIIIKSPVIVSPPPNYLELNKRPHCDYEDVNGIINCLEDYKSLANINDNDKLNIRKWIKDNSKDK